LFQMFPPLSCLFRLILFLLCFPLRKLPLPFLALEKRLYLREQKTGRDTRFLSYNATCYICPPKGNTSSLRVNANIRF